MKLILMALLICAAAAHGMTLAERIGEITKEHTSHLAVVRGDEAAGSAFVARFGKGTYLFTNQHVIAGNVNPTFTLPDQTKLKVGTAAAAEGHDVMSFYLPPDPTAFEVMLGVDKFTSIGDDVVVLGNPDGAGVIHPIAGKIVGVGPQLLEISAEFVAGNSGSPVVHLKTGKVIGIATFLRLERADFKVGRMADEIRRFCFRIDSIQKWDPVRWADYNDEELTVRRVHQRTKEISELLLDVPVIRNVNANSVTDPEVRGALQTFLAADKAAATNEQRVQVAEKFVGDLRRLSVSDLEPARRRIGYDYFHTMLQVDEYLRRSFPPIFEAVLSGKPAEVPAGKPARGTPRQR